MKTTSYCFILFLFLSSESPAQTYHPFPVHQAFWNMDYTMPGPFGQPFHMERFYFLNGDTLVNNVVYHKMFMGDTSAGSTQLPPIALIREQNKQVFCRSYHVNFFDDEYLLYDFNLTVGDTFSFPEVLDSVRMVLAAINTEMTSTGPRTAYDFNIIVNPINVYYANPRWVEGIGDIKKRCAAA